MPSSSENLFSATNSLRRIAGALGAIVTVTLREKMPAAFEATRVNSVVLLTVSERLPAPFNAVFAPTEPGPG